MSTSATKVEVRELDSGRVVARGSAPHPPTQPPRSEQPPAAWWAALESAWQQVGQPSVAAISVAGQQHGMVALDRDRQVIRPAKLWNDTESAPDAARLISQLDGGRKAWAEATGLVPVASFTITKLSWLHRSEPEAWRRLAHVLLPHDWLTFRLTGHLVTDRGDASGTGYWWPPPTPTARSCWRSSTPSGTGRPCCRRSSAPRRRRRVARCHGRRRYRRQHGGRPRHRAGLR
jgi:xylulokinase